MASLSLAYTGVDRERLAAFTAAPLLAARPYTLVQMRRKRSDLPSGSCTTRRGSPGGWWWQ
jgi:hypothetical protein